MMVELSFCIPTYNRSESSNRLVREILSVNDNAIEVVVLDNGSTDNTLEALNSIQDKRLKIYANGENKGALFNMINVLTKANGKYLIYSTDQDFINSSNIENFKEFLLKNESISCGYCEFSPDNNATNQIFSKGYETINNIAYLSRHPSGYFFNGEILKKINYLEHFGNYDYVDLFPFEFIFAELGLMGNGAIYNKQLNIPETATNKVAKNKSSTTNGKSSKAFFTPTSRLKLALNYTNHINQLSLQNDEKMKLIRNVFIRGLFASTFGYKSLLQNHSLCEHYYIIPRNMRMFELLSIGTSFFSEFFSKADYINNSYSNKIRFFFGIFSNIMYKSLMKIYKKVLKS